MPVGRSYLICLSPVLSSWYRVPQPVRDVVRNSKRTRARFGRGIKIFAHVETARLTLRQVFRYTALASGIVYGIVHKRTLLAEQAAKKSAQHEHRHEHLVAEARKAWQAKQAAKSSTGDGGAHFLSTVLNQSADLLISRAVITDPENPKFDLEKLVAKWEREAQ